MTANGTRTHLKESSLKSFGVDRWGVSFLHANRRGHLVFDAPQRAGVDLFALSERLAEEGVGTPFVLRFPSMIVAQVERFRSAFAAAVRTYDYRGGHRGVYPLKVNQQRSVVEAILEARRRCEYGLEAGSKSELVLAMSQPPIDGRMLLVNGFKDRDFIRMAFHAAELGHEVVVILESLREVRRYIGVAKEREWRVPPDIGVRAKLSARGSGRWKKSGGEASKFGLSSGELVALVQELSDAELSDRLTLLHFHIGSQITQIKRIKQAAREAARLYGGMAGYCARLKYLDLGGGVGVDYDGSKTSYPSSANYSLEEYASQVVYEIGEVIDEMNVEPPTIITESGRVIVASHALMVTDLREVQGEMLPVSEESLEGEHRVVWELRETLRGVTTKNYEEYFHDAIDFRDESLTLFSTGSLSLEERATCEALFQRIRQRVSTIILEVKRPSEEITDFLARAQSKYLANFSVFQSLPDAWSIGQVFPAAPLSRHNERPTIQAQIVDITCDSDGCVTEFAHPDENLRVLPLHERRSKDENYYLAFFMVGAYQDSLANSHNLLARCHEVIVHGEGVDRSTNPESEWIDFEGNVLEVRRGAPVAETLRACGFSPEQVAADVAERHASVTTTLGAQWAQELMSQYPYLKR